MKKVSIILALLTFLFQGCVTSWKDLAGATIKGAYITAIEVDEVILPQLAQQCTTLLLEKKIDRFVQCKELYMSVGLATKTLYRMVKLANLAVSMEDKQAALDYVSKAIKMQGEIIQVVKDFLELQKQLDQKQAEDEEFPTKSDEGSSL